MKTVLLLIGIALMSTSPVTYKTNQALSSMKILGTSTLHDWEMEAENLYGTIDVDLYPDSLDIKELHLTVPVQSLKSGKEPMDDNAYKALKSKDHPKIIYKLKGVKGFKTINNNQMRLTTVGDLTVAGSRKTMQIPITATTREGGISLSGQVTFEMSDFGVEPPTFMFGTITTGDEITIEFNINYN